MTEAKNVPNVIDVIQQDHLEIEALLARVADPGTDGRDAAFDELAALLAKHEAAEEAVVRPEMEKIDGAEAEARDLEEAKADEMLERLRTMEVGSSEFEAAFAKFRSSVLTHAKHEETEEHPKLEANLEAGRLEDLGQDFVRAEEDAS